MLSWRRFLATLAFVPSQSFMFKRAKLDSSTISPKVIGTHSGTFQADEAMGVWMLQQLPTYRNAKVVRSRDNAVLDDLDIVLDVGGVYDHAKLRYDHHQRGYDERFVPKTGETEERCTKLSASGLIYRHYGRELLQVYYPDLNGDYLEQAFMRMYDSLLEALDAIDTGVEMAETTLYSDSTGLSRRVSRLNPRWNEEGIDPDERFQKAVALCGDDFVSVLTSVVESDLPARAVVAEALSKRKETDESEQIVCFPKGGLPWKNHLYALEKEHGLDSEDKQIKFVLYTDQSGMWRIQAVTVEGQAFTNRLSLPESWRGLRDEELAKASGIDDVRFVHAAGFIGGASSYESVLKMAGATLASK